MRIKEVEKHTGLTAKAIRLYESRGLLSVARETENDYREYTPEDVERLKTIAVLRRLDVPLKDIKRWCDGEVTMPDLLHRVLGEAMLESREADRRLTLTRELAKVLDEEPDKPLPQAIEEAETLRELYEGLEEICQELRGDLFSPVYATILALGPVGWTVLRILNGETEKALLSFGVSLLVVPYVAYRWFRFFAVERTRRKAGCLWFIPGVILGLALAFASLFFVLMCQEHLFGPERGWYLFRTPWMYLSLLYPLGAVLFLAEDRAKTADDLKDEEETPAQKRKNALAGWCVVLAFHVLFYYGCITGVSYFTGETFSRHSFFCPQGKTYTLADVEQVEAGFYGKWSWLPWEQAGDFYYRVTFSDGKTENWTDLTSVTDGDEDPWLELLELANY